MRRHVSDSYVNGYHRNIVQIPGQSQYISYIRRESMSKKDFREAHVAKTPINTTCNCMFKDVVPGTLVVQSGSERFGPLVYCGESSHSTASRHMVKVMPMEEDNSEGLYALHQPCNIYYVPHPPPWPFSRDFITSESTVTEPALAEGQVLGHITKKPVRDAFWLLPPGSWTTEESEEWKALENMGDSA